MLILHWTLLCNEIIHTPGMSCQARWVTWRMGGKELLRLLGKYQNMFQDRLGCAKMLLYDVFSNAKEEHLSRLQSCLEKLGNENLVMNLRMCESEKLGICKRQGSEFRIPGRTGRGETTPG